MGAAMMNEGAGRWEEVTAAVATVAVVVAEAAEEVVAAVVVTKTCGMQTSTPRGFRRDKCKMNC
jgi:hypothetical protein